MNKTARTLSFWSKFTLAPLSLLFRKNDVLTIMNMTFSFLKGIDLVCSYKLNVNNSWIFHVFIYINILLSPFSLSYFDICVSVSRHRLLHMWKVAFFFFFTQKGVLSYIVMQNIYNVFAFTYVFFYLHKFI